MSKHQTNISAIPATHLDLHAKILAGKARAVPVTVSKDIRLGNMARTEIALSEMEMPGFVLTLTTCKRSSGTVSSVARVDIVENGFLTHRVYRDFNKKVAESKKMATVSAVRAMHEQALLGMHFTLVEVAQHYLAMEAAAEPA